ncbi:MAG: MFS transporter [Halobacteriaceae archaeon]
MSFDADGLEFPSLYLTRFATSFGFMTVLTLLPTYIETLHATGVTVGLFVAALEVARTAGIVPLGWAGDRYDKRTVLVGSLALSVVAYLAFGAVDTVPGFLGARLLQGLSLTGVGMLSLALVGELSPADRRANRIGRYNAARMAAGIAGTLGAGALYHVFGFGVVFGLLGVVLAVATASVALFVGADGTSVEGFAFADVAVNPKIATVTGFRAQYAVAVSLVRKWVPIFVGVSAASGGLGHGAVVVGAVLAAEKFTNMLCQPFTGRLSDRHGRAVFLFFGGGAYGLVAMAFPFVRPLAAAGVALPVVGAVSGAVLAAAGLNALLGVADAVREPASMALFADEGDGDGIASSFGVRSLVWKPGSVLAPLAGGWVMGTYGLDWVFFLGGAAALSGVVTFFGLLARQPGDGALTRW